MTVAEKLKSWLDEIGADGLMNAKGFFFRKEDIATLRMDFEVAIQLVPAFRHADGTYHTEPEASHDEHCPCICQAFKDWNKHKEDGR